jgi:RNA polymerase sigma-70 factor (ECF subfamily)
VPDFRAQLERLNQYATLFNTANWDGLRALLAEEVRLDMVSRSQRSGKLVSQYFTNYQKRPGIRLVPGLLEGRPALAAHDPGTSAQPTYFILLDWTGDKVTFIRDYSHVPYIAEGAVFQPS